MKTRRIAVPMAAGIALALGLGACGNGEEPANGASAAGAEVRIATFMYEPDPVQVSAGEAVSFTNEDDILHTVTAGTRKEPTGEFNEDLDGPGAAAEITLDESGTYEYFCDVHAGMEGTIEVE